MPSEIVLRTIRETYEETLAKRNAAMQAVEKCRETYRRIAAKLCDAETERNSARQAEEAIRREHSELTCYRDLQLDTLPQPLIDKIDKRGAALLERQSQTRRAEEIFATCQKELEDAQNNVELAERNSKT